MAVAGHCLLRDGSVFDPSEWRVLLIISSLDSNPLSPSFAGLRNLLHVALGAVT